VWRKPRKGTYRGAQVVSAPPPSAGGIFVLQVLNLLERFDVVRHSSADRLHLLAEAQKLAWADRAAYVGDPEFVGVPADELTSKSYADRRRVLIDMARAGNPGPGTVRGSQPASPGQSRRSGNYTIHLSVIDAAGNAVALTCSLGDPFGNTVVPAGSGLLLNTQITSGETLDPLAPRRRARTSMTPTIVAQGGEPILAVGGAGSKKIPMGVLQAIVNVIDHDMDVARALDAARLSEPQCCTMELESARVLPDVIAELGRRGHEVAAVGEYAPLPILAAAGVDRASGDRLAADDPRGQFAPVAARRPPSG
jgi:gamma-glutamyltranspeptidase/glutathione hydrolase